MHSFDFVCVGAGGGPVETDLSAYLLKAADTRWEDGIVAVEAGSGIGALRAILSSTRHAFFDIQATPDEPHELLASRIYSYIQTFLISHSHLDHVLSLVLSAGSLPDPPPIFTSPVKRRRIVGTKQVLEDLATMVFSDRIWPNLASWSSEGSVPDYLYLYDPVTSQDTPTAVGDDQTKVEGVQSNHYHPISSKISVLAMPISHGLCRSNHAHSPSGTYTSSAFFIHNVDTQKQFLFFGDVEPDSLALNPSTKDVWRTAASLMTTSLPSGAKVLDSVFIECSWPTTRGDKELYGHLNPQHLLQEMKVLASEISRLQEARLLTSPISPGLLQKLASHAGSNTAPSHDREKSLHLSGPPKKPRRRTIIRRASRPNTIDSGASEASTPTASSIVVPLPNGDAPAPKEPGSVKGVLRGIKLYVMHFKAPMEPAKGVQQGKLSQHIVSELRTLVEQDGLGLEVIAMEQGMRISI